jgi:hypothetical protein
MLTHDATFTLDATPLPGGQGLGLALHRNGAPLSVRATVDLWQREPGFAAWFNGALAALPFAAFRWETPAVTRDTADQAFVCVALDSPSLARAPEPEAFAAHFARSPGAPVVEFSNLGGDAILVVPTPAADPSAYGHLGAFVRQAPAAQHVALWAQVGAAMERRLGPRPVWLSTAGAGVSWLHVRLDDKPKYYGHAPFRGAPGAPARERPWWPWAR